MSRRRLYPWRSALTKTACVGPEANPHPPLVFAKLEQTDPVHAPYEWTCPRCNTVGPSVFWDTKVPVPPHDFIAGAERIYCRVCLHFSDDRMWHPEPPRPMFDPSRISSISPAMSLGGWHLCLDNSLGTLEAYVDREAQRIAVSTETYFILNASVEAFNRFMDDNAFGNGAGGMRFLAGIPTYDQAVAAYRHERNEDVVVAKDEITQLLELAHSLVTQAASVGYHGKPEQQQILTGRYLAARTRFEGLRSRLEALDAELDLAGYVVMSEPL